MGSTRSAIDLYVLMSASTSYSKPSNRLEPSNASTRSLDAKVSGSLRSPARMPLRVAYTCIGAVSANRTADQNPPCMA
jgi:hypothetical protein